jgi:type IV pilus assembly protein PilF
VQANSTHKDAHYYLGHLYASQGKSKEAKAEFQKVLRIDPGYSDARSYLGIMLEQQGRTAEAIAAYRKALSDPLYVMPETAWLNLGRAVRRQGQLREAVNAFTEAARLMPSSLPPDMT